MTIKFAIIHYDGEQWHFENNENNGYTENEAKIIASMIKRDYREYKKDTKVHVVHLCTIKELEKK